MMPTRRRCPRLCPPPHRRSAESFSAGGRPGCRARAWGPPVARTAISRLTQPPSSRGPPGPQPRRRPCSWKSETKSSANARDLRRRVQPSPKFPQVQAALTQPWVPLARVCRYWNLQGCGCRSPHSSCHDRPLRSRGSWPSSGALRTPRGDADALGVYVIISSSADRAAPAAAFLPVTAVAVRSAGTRVL